MVGDGLKDAFAIESGNIILLKKSRIFGKHIMFETAVLNS